MKEKKEEVGLNRLERNRSLEKSEYKKQALRGGRQSVGKKTTLFILNLAILASKYFAGFYFGDFNAQIWRKGLNFAHSQLHFKKESVNLQNSLDKLEQGMREIFSKLTLFHKWRYKMGLPLKLVSNLCLSMHNCLVYNNIICWLHTRASSTV